MPCQNAVNTEPEPAMSAPAPHTDPSAHPPKGGGSHRPDWLPSRTALLIAAVAFVAGLLLFGALWLDQRSSNDFYKTDGVPRSVEGQAFEPLPAPLPASDTGHLGPGEQQEDAGVADTQPAAPAPAAPAPVAPPIAPPPVQAPPPLADASLPRPVDAPPPRYPRDAQRRRQQGTVLMRVHVDAQGNPGDIDIVAGSGTRSLDRAAVEAVRRWRFAPAVRNGQPVAGTVQVPIDFTLQR